MFYNFALVVGAVTSLVWLYQFFYFIWRAFIRPSKNLSKYGSWAVVTGASDGIGFAQAYELARNGINLVLISRSKDKLMEKCMAIKEKFPQVEVQIVVADFSGAAKSLYSSINSAIKDLDIGILINNVGVSYEFPDFFQNLTDAEVQNMIDVNVTAATNMTRLVVPGMIERKRGAIVNVGSIAGSIAAGSPLLSLYAGTKAFVDFFSRSLYHELHSQGIDVQVPLFVTTKMSKIRSTSLTIPSPAAFARASLRAIGYESTIVPYWSHAIQAWALSLLPEFVAGPYLRGMHIGVRKRALQRQSKSKSN